mmetsp:Transcript_36872/g.72499  ORF Transcript_36872/g.72499 Transcript_36872/m.72499 type:complete len:172 (-) Transcript_36872:34-549(-)
MRVAELAWARTALAQAEQLLSQLRDSRLQGGGSKRVKTVLTQGHFHAGAQKEQFDKTMAVQEEGGSKAGSRKEESRHLITETNEMKSNEKGEACLPACVSALLDFRSTTPRSRVHFFPPIRAQISVHCGIRVSKALTQQSDCEFARHSPDLQKIKKQSAQKRTERLREINK